jgi:hypothetical protein
MVACSVALWLALGASGGSASGPQTWKEIAVAVEYATFRLVETPEHGDGLLHVVRVDPGRTWLRVVLASEEGVPNRTAGNWAEGLGLTVAINAGMFATDHRSNVGYLRRGSHLNQPRWSPKYQSVLTFGHPRIPSSRREPSPLASQARLIDLDAKTALGEVQSSHTVIQNLRLIRGPGVNVWKPSHRRWSEAAIAQDQQGRLLFLFTRTPFSMHEFNQKLLALPLGVERAMHVEGGPEASLSIRTPSLSVDLCGSYETGFNEADHNVRQWPLPNVVGVFARELP